MFNRKSIIYLVFYVEFKICVLYIRVMKDIKWYPCTETRYHLTDDVRLFMEDGVDRYTDIELLSPPLIV